MPASKKDIRNKIAIIGVGAIGSVIANALRTNPNNQLFFYTRTPKCEIKVEFEGKQVTFPIKCETAPIQNEKMDWVIICLKAHQFKEAAPLFKSLIGDNTKVAIIRNGINLSEDLEPYTSKKRTLPCMIDCPVQPKENGFYWQLGYPLITTNKSELADAFHHLFPKEAINIKQVDDLKTAIWKNLIESSALGSIQCLTGQTCKIFEDSKVLNLCQQLIKEGMEVAIADGANIHQNFEETLIQKILNYPKDKGSSMLTDRINGNKIELDAKNGAISKMARMHKVATSLNDLFCTLIKQINVR